MAQYQVGRSVYELPDDLDNATLNATLQQLAEQEAIRPRDGALAYSADQAQRLFGRAGQTIGTAFGIDSLEEAGRQYAAEQEQDIQQGGYQTSIQDKGFIEAVQNGRGMSYVGTMIAENGVGTAATLGLGAAAGVAGVLAMPVTAAVLGGTALAAGIGMGIGEATEVAEQAGVDTSTQGSALANVAVGTISGLLERIGAKGVVPTEQLARMSVGEVADQLVKKGKTSAAKKFLKTVASGAVSEGATETSQSALMLNNAMLQGGEFTTDELVNDLVDSFVVGAATGAGATTGISGVAGAASKLKSSSGIEVGDPEAAAVYAKRLEAIVEKNGYDLDDIDKSSTTGAREAVDKSHIRMSIELKRKFDDLKTRVKITDSDSFEELADKILAEAAYREGRNKTKSTVGVEEMEALERLAGDTMEGQDTIALLREMNEMTRLHNNGYQGGVSQYTDQLAPFGTKVGYDKGAIATERILRPLTSGGLAIQTGGTSLAAQAGIQAGGRAIDKITGKRSKVKNYIEQNVGNEGIPASTGQSLRLQKQAALAQEEADAQAEAQRRGDLNEALFQAGAPAKEDSPQGAMQIGVPLPIEDILAAMPEVVRQFPQLEQAAADFERSVVRGGKVQDLTELIRATKTVTGVDGDAMRRAEQIEAGQTVRTLGANYERGVESNRQFANELRDGINDDKTISPADKAVMLTALDDFGRNLGKNPAEAIQAKMKDIYERAGDKDAAMKYLMPYVERVMAQQDAKSQIDDFIGQLRDDNLFSDPDAMETPQFAEGNPMRVSPSRPEGAKRIADPMQEDRQIGLAAIQDDPKLVEKIESNIADYVGVPDTSIEGLIRHSMDNLRHLFNSVTPEFRERARQWYVGANKLSQQTADTNGLSLESVAGVMASLSPQKDWYMNYDLGVRTINVFMNHQDSVFDADMRQAFVDMIENPQAKRSEKAKKILYQALEEVDGKTLAEIEPKRKGYFVRFHDEVYNPEKGHRVVTPEGELGDFVTTQKGAKSGTAWNGFRDINKAISILEDPSRQNISDQLGEKHKVRSFYNNILDPFAPQGDVTIDTHAVAAALLRPLSGKSIEVLHNFKDAGTSKNIGAFGSYGVYAEAYRRLASELGVQPRELQSITWEAVRNLFTQGFKGQKKNVDAIDDIWKSYTDGTISIDEARSKIYDTAGGINRAEWETALRPDDAIDAGDGNQTQSGSILDTSLSGRRDNRRDTGEPAGLLLQASEDLTKQGQLFLEEEIASTKEVLGEPELPIRAPTPTEIKTQEPTVKAFFEVGKEGSPYENGMNADDVNNLGLMLGYMIVDAPNKAKMGDIVRRKIRSNEHYAGVNMVYTNASVPHTIGLLAEGYVNPKDPENQNVSSLDYLFTKAHEIVGHALENRPFGFEYLNQQDMTGKRMNPNRSGYMVIEQSINAPEGGIYPDGRTLEQGETDLVDVDDVNRSDNAVLFQRGQQFSHQNNRDLPTIENPVTGQTESGRLDTIRGQLAKRLENLDTKDFDSKKVSKELIAFQKSRVSSSRNPELGSKRVRSAYTMYERGMAMGQRASASNYIATVQRNNIHKMAELLADGFAGYAVNPKEFKQNYPETAKMIRFFQNDPNNKSSKFIQFYAHPLPTVLAVALAMFGIAAGGGEERPPEGALSPSGGALTI